MSKTDVEPIPPTESRRINLTVPDDDWRKLERLASRKRVATATLVRMLIGEAVDKEYADA